MSGGAFVYRLTPDMLRELADRDLGIVLDYRQSWHDDSAFRIRLYTAVDRGEFDLMPELVSSDMLERAREQ